MLKIFSPTPTNSEIAKSVGKTEGAIRALKKQLPDENIELINLTYKKDNYPFVKIEEFLQIINEDKIKENNYTQEQIQKDKEFINNAVENKKICGDGEFTKKCNAWLEERRDNALHCRVHGAVFADGGLCARRQGTEPPFHLVRRGASCTDKRFFSVPRKLARHHAGNAGAHVRPAGRKPRVDEPHDAALAPASRNADSYRRQVITIKEARHYRSRASFEY